jgi:hypothetical protein
MKTKTSATKHSMNRSHCQLALLLIPLALACFALSPTARAVCQQGCFSLENTNTALGEDALVNVGFGNSNTAVGKIALQFNTDGHRNTAVGFGALQFNQASENTAIGYGGLANNTTGFSNTAVGQWALADNTIGIRNTASGYLALSDNTTGNFNMAIGGYALAHNTVGSNNIAVGFKAGLNLTTGSNNIDIGNAGVTGESNTIRIGKVGTQNATFIAGISGATVPTGVAVIVDADGHLGTTTSSARFKAAIKPMDKSSEAILALKPVTFRYKQEIDPDGILQFGLVAEQVEKVNPDLVARDANGKAYTVRYEAVNAMLLNEFLKEHRKVEVQQAMIAQLKAADAKQEEKISALTELVKEQAAQIQKVSAQLELNKTAPRTALNDQ